MLQFGRAITKTGDQLQKIDLSRLYLGIHRPKQAFRDLIEQLRMVRSIDENQYKNLKKQLPYFVCGIFHPPIRRKEHFAQAQYFILDIDHLEVAKQAIDTVKANLTQLPSVTLLFKSPSGDGLKVLFRLKEPCRDQALFSAFYKLFARQFAENNGLQEVLDYRTSDVTRACFLSYDSAAYYNPDSEVIDLQQYIPDLDFTAAEKDLKAADAFVKKAQIAAQYPQTNELASEVFQKIKAKLNPNYRQPKQKQYFVPPQVDKAIENLNEVISEFNLQIVETKPISYGRKIKLASAGLWAELNIFYGKNGYKIIKTTKTGSNGELGDLSVQVITQILATLPTNTAKNG